MCVCTLLRGQLYFQQKNMCFAIWACVDTKFLNSSHHVLSVDDWPGDAIFFPGGQPLKIIRKYSIKKGPAPWILFLTPAIWPLEVTFLVGEGEHMCLYPFAKSCKESYCTPSINHGTFFSWGLIFRCALVNPHLIHPPSNSWLLTLGILQTYPLSESFMIDFLMPYIHRLIPPQSQQTEIDFLSLYVRKLSGKKLGLFWYDIFFLAPYHAPGPSPTVC